MGTILSADISAINTKPSSGLTFCLNISICAPKLPPSRLRADEGGQDFRRTRGEAEGRSPGLVSFVITHTEKPLNPQTLYPYWGAA